MIKSLWDKYKKRRQARKEKEKNMTPFETVVSWIKTIVGAFIVVLFINGLAIASFVVPTGSMENTVMTGDFLFVNKFVYGPSTPQYIPFLDIALPYYKFPGIQDPEKGDVIVFVYPGDRDRVEARQFQYFLKRCVGTAGDTIEVRDNVLYVNGEEFEKPEHIRYNPNLQALPGERNSLFPRGKNFTRAQYGPVVVPKEGDEITLDQENYLVWETFIKREGHDIKVRGGKIFIDDVETNKYTVQRDYCFGMGDNRDNSSDSRYWGFIPKEDIVGSPIVVYWSWDTNMPISGFLDKLKSIRWDRIGTLID